MRYCRKSLYFLRRSLINVGMKKPSPPQLSEKEHLFIEQLRRHPELAARFESILALASAQDGPIKTADQVEELLVEEVRALGNQTMNQWARNAEERIGREQAGPKGALKSRKKKR